MERVLRHGSIEHYVDVLLGIKHNHDPRTREERFLHRRSVERVLRHQRKKIVLILCWISSTIMIPKTREKKFLHRGSMERVQRYRSIKDYAGPFLGINHQNDSLNRKGEVPTPWMSGKGPTPWKYRRLF